MRVVLASNNKGKIRELRALGPDIEWVTMAEAGLEGHDPPETGNTFEANALQKAQYVYDRVGGDGVVVVADDSGLEVDALNGGPGVFSKRFSPEQTDVANNAYLLHKLAGVPLEERTARYVCVVAVISDEGSQTTRATCEGHIPFEGQGDNGFGYDPVFVPEEFPGRTAAEITMDEKNQISHRGKAFRALLGLLSA